MNLKEMSLKLYPGMMVLWPTTGIVEPLDMEVITHQFGKQKVYSIGKNGNTICYLYAGEPYVTPRTREAIAILNGSGCRFEHFYVPFDAGDVPENERGEWERLLRRASFSYRQEFLDNCQEWSLRLKIHFLPKSVIKNCFEIPVKGIDVKNHALKEHISPVLNQEKPDPMTSSYLGRYCAHNGLVVFVDKKGRTYVAKGYGIVRRLKRAGYRETGMFVPFSNGALPVDKELCGKWITIPRFE